MNTTGASRISAVLFWGIVLISCVCMGAVSGLINGCSITCEPDPAVILRSYPAENSFHRIDLVNPDPPGFIQQIATYLY